MARAWKLPSPRMGRAAKAKYRLEGRDSRPGACLAHRLRRAHFPGFLPRGSPRADSALSRSPQRPPAVGKGSGRESAGTQKRPEQLRFQHARHRRPIGLRCFRGARFQRSPGRSLLYERERVSPPGDPCEMVVAAYDFEGRWQWHGSARQVRQQARFLQLAGVVPESAHPQRRSRRRRLPGGAGSGNRPARLEDAAGEQNPQLLRAHHSPGRAAGTS